MKTDAVWTAFSGRLRAFIAKRVRNDADIDDILQDVFAKIDEDLSKLREDGRLEAWLFQVARRRIADHHRRRRPIGLREEPAEKPASPDVSAEIASWLEPMMSLIPEEDRRALRAVDVEGLSQKELAGRLGLSVTGARSRVQRARARLKEALLDCCILETDGRGTPNDYSRKREYRGPRPCCPEVTSLRGP